MANLDNIFQRWLETGELTPENRKLLEKDSVYAELLDNSEKWKTLANDYQETPVPDWKRDATWFEKSSKSSMMAKLNAWFAPAALACSVIMCSLVVMRTELNVDEQGFSLRFYESNETPAVTYEQLQILFAEQQKANAEATFALVKEAIDQGRLERKEDIGALVSHLNEVRQQDQALIRLQMHELAEQVESQPRSSIAKN